MSDEGLRVGSSRNTSKLKQENRRRLGKKVVVAGLRTTDNDDEMFAVVLKMLGNGMCEVSCADGVHRLCIIRKKFRGRQKHRNLISPGITVMVGLRTWEKNEKAGLEKCDMLEVYNDSELRKLKQRGALKLDKASRDSVITENDEIEFAVDANGGGGGGRGGDAEEIAGQPHRDYDLSHISSDDEGEDSDVDIDNL